MLAPFYRWENRGSEKTRSCSWYGKGIWLESQAEQYEALMLWCLYMALDGKDCWSDDWLEWDDGKGLLVKSPKTGHSKSALLHSLPLTPPVPAGPCIFWTNHSPNPFGSSQVAAFHLCNLKGPFGILRAQNWAEMRPDTELPSSPHCHHQSGSRGDQQWPFNRWVRQGRGNHLLSFKRPRARQEFKAVPPLLLGLSDGQGVGIGMWASTELKIAQNSLERDHHTLFHIWGNCIPTSFSSFDPLKPTRHGWPSCLELCSCPTWVTEKSRHWMATSYTCVCIPQRTLLMNDVHSMFRTETV